MPKNGPHCNQKRNLSMGSQDCSDHDESHGPIRQCAGSGHPSKESKFALLYRISRHGKETGQNPKTPISSNRIRSDTEFRRPSGFTYQHHQEIRTDSQFKHMMIPNISLVLCPQRARDSHTDAQMKTTAYRSRCWVYQSLPPSGSRHSICRECFGSTAPAGADRLRVAL